MSKLDRLEIKGSAGVVLGRLGKGVSTGSVRAGLFLDLTTSITFFFWMSFFLNNLDIKNFTTGGLEETS